MKRQKTTTTKKTRIANTISRKNKVGRHTIQPQDLLQSHSNQNSMAWAKKQKKSEKKAIKSDSIKREYNSRIPVRFTEYAAVMGGKKSIYERNRGKGGI